MAFDPADFCTRVRAHYDNTVANLPVTLAEQVERLKVAPFAADPATVRPGPLLVVSMKPYGAYGPTYDFGWEERAQLPGLHRWYDGHRATSNFVVEADRLLRGVLAEIAPGTDPRRVPNTYAYFYRAKDARQLKGFGLDRVECKNFHREIIDEVRPRLVLCIGNGPAPSAYATYRELLGVKTQREVRPVFRNVVRWGTGEDGRLVLGVPHLSYARAGLLLPAVLGAIAEDYSARPIR